MSDINRPLRRLEIARRIQELRDRAAQEAVPAAPEADAAPETVDTPETDAAPETGREIRDGAPRHLADSEPRDVPEEIPDDAQPAGPDAFLPGEDASAAATIASLLRGGQTWILDRGK